MRLNITLKMPKMMLDKAFRRAAEVKAHLKDLKHQKEKALNKISTVENVLKDELNRIIKGMPHIDNMEGFYKELFSSYMPIREYKKSLYHVSWTSRKISYISSEIRKRIKYARDEESIAKFLKSYYGRISSLMEELEDSIECLIEAIKIFKRFPEINTSKEIFIVAGYPNVGKSSLVKSLTGASVKVEPYPFTTKDLLVGEEEYFVLVDTPGILENRFDMLNNIEKKGYLALRYLSKNIIFVFDPTLSSGYSLNDQKRLFEDVITYFKPINIIKVYTKVDLLESREKEKNVFYVSSLSGEGIEDLKRYLIKNALSSLSKSMKSMRY